MATKITKMQQRRGLRRDLPLPLAPGEFGLATDSRELFIGNDVTDSLSGIHNRTVQIGFFATGFDFTNTSTTGYRYWAKYRLQITGRSNIEKLCTSKCEQ